MGLAQRTAKALLNSLFGKTSDFGALASAPTVYVALSTTDPGADGSGATEVSGSNYARVSTAASDWNSAANVTGGGKIDNANAVTFNTPSGSWGDVTHAMLYDAATDGNFLGYAPLSSTRTVSSGDDVEFEAGDLAFTLVDDD